MTEGMADGMTEAQRVVHELNNALMTVNGYAEVVLSRLEEDDPLHRHVNAIHVAGLRAAELARTLTNL
jgi:signal transduction histidine kinase